MVVYEILSAHTFNIYRETPNVQLISQRAQYRCNAAIGYIKLALYTKHKTKHLTVEFASKWEKKDTSFTLEMERQHIIFSHIQQKKTFLLLLSEGDMSRMVGTNKCEKEMLNLIEVI